MSIDYVPITRELFGEDWPTFEEPEVPNLSTLKRLIAAVARDFAGRHVFELRWLPTIKVHRGGKTIRANTVYDVPVPYREFFDDERGLFINEWASAMIPLPRFGVLQLVPERQARKEWEKKRWLWKPGTVNGQTVNVRVDLYGTFPSSGYYREMPAPLGMLTNHLPGALCCRESTAKGINCYGRYRPPSFDMVEWLRQGWDEKKHLEKQYRMPADDEVEQEIARYANEKTALVDNHREQFFAGVSTAGAEEVNDALVNRFAVTRPPPAPTDGRPLIVAP